MLFYLGAQLGDIGNSDGDQDIRISLQKNTFTPVSEAANTFSNRKSQVIHLGTNHFHCNMRSHQLKVKKKKGSAYQGENFLLISRIMTTCTWP